MKASLGVPLVVAGACLAVRAEAQSVVVGPQASAMSTVRHGMTAVPVVIEATGGGDSLGSLAGRLSWRPAVLRLVGASAGTLGALAVNADTVGGVIRFALASPTGVSGTAVVLNATFEAVGAPGDTASITAAVDEATRARTFADLTSQAIATSARFCVSTGRWGDLNLNDTLSGFDALLMLTEGVGLPIAPYTTVNGDVDGNGRIDSRDALIVLSAAVGLPTPGFRVGALNTGSCAVRSVVSLALAPLSPTLASGDRVRAVAVAFDSAGQIVNSAPVAWGVSDTAIAVVDQAGNVYARAAGSVRVYAVALPGVRDSATIAVGGVRHTWYVDPVRAAASRNQIGTAFEPFATFAQALAAAAVGDTVRVASGTYTEPLRIFKPVVVIGDSGVAGWPRLVVAGAPAIVVDSLPAGAVTVVDLVVAGGTAGVVTGDADVTLHGLRIAGVAGPGIVARGTRHLAVDQSSVAGPAGRGVDFEGPGAVNLSRVTVSQVPADAGVRIVGAESVTLDSLQVSGVGGDGTPDAAAVRLDLPATATVTANDVVVTAGFVPGVIVTGGGAVTLRRLGLDRSQVLGLFGEAARFSGMASLLLDSLRVSVTNGIVRFLGAGSGTAELRAPVLNGAAVEASGLARLRVTGGAITAPPKQALVATGIPSVTVTGTQILAASSLGGGDLGVAIVHADSANVSDVTVHGVTGLPVECGTRGPSAAVRVDSTRAVVLRGLDVQDMACIGILVGWADVATVAENHVTGVQVSGINIPYVRVVNLAGNVVRDVLRRPGTTTVGSGSGISVAWGDTLRSAGDSIVNVGGRGLAVNSMSSGTVDRLVVLLPDRDSIASAAVYFTKGRYALTNSHLADTRSGNLVSVYAGTSRLFSRGNRLERSGLGGFSTAGSAFGSPAIGYPDTLVSVADTVLTTRSTALIAQGAKFVRVDSAVVDSAGSNGVYVIGTAATVFTSTGARVSRVAIGIYNDSSASATIENAIVTDYRGTGVYVRFGGPVVIRSLVATRTQPYTGQTGIYVLSRRAVVMSDVVARRNLWGIDLRNVADSVRGIRLRADSGGVGLSISSASDGSLDSLALSDNAVYGLIVDSGGGLRLTASTMQRNGLALSVSNPGGVVSISGSVFNSNVRGVANVSSVYPVDAGSNYWGDARGPRCNVAITGTPCDAASTGDSVQTANVLFMPFLTAAPADVFAAPPSGAASVPVPAPAPWLMAPAARRTPRERQP